MSIQPSDIQLLDWYWIGVVGCRLEIETTDHNSCAPAENVLDGTHERPQVVHSTPDSHLFIHQIAKAKVPKCQWIKMG